MLTIAMTGDLHYPLLPADDEELNAARDAFFEGFFNEFLNTKADVHLSLVDTTHRGLLEEYAAVQRYVERAPVHFRHLFGNHDVMSLPKQTLLQSVRAEQCGRMEADEAMLLFLDTTKELELSGWGLDSQQWHWLEEQIERCRDKPLLVYTHHPVPGTTEPFLSEGR